MLPTDPKESRAGSICLTFDIHPACMGQTGVHFSLSLAEEFAVEYFYIPKFLIMIPNLVGFDRFLPFALIYLRSVARLRLRPPVSPIEQQ